MPPSGAGAGGTSGPDDKPDKKPEKSYLASTVESLNPWAATRSTTPTPKEAQPPKPAVPQPAQAATKKADDHSVNTLYGQSFKRYPSDCPPLKVQWFHASDVHKRKPNSLKSKKEIEADTKPAPPKKFVTFSVQDSRSIENGYQKLLEEVEEERARGMAIAQTKSATRHARAVSIDGPQSPDIKSTEAERHPSLRVPVNEDFLFDVDIEERELAPVYWDGPIFEVRRGSWFYQEGSTLRPCEENLAAQLEEGYLKTKPWAYPTDRARSNSAAQSVSSKTSSENIKAAAKSQGDASLKVQSPLEAQHQPQTYRLFGTYMNSIATYQDSNTAWLSSESVFSWVTSTVYQKFAGGGYMNGVKLVRGYTDPGKSKDTKPAATPATATFPPEQVSEKEQKALRRQSAPSGTTGDTKQDDAQLRPGQANEDNPLTRQLSSYIETSDNPELQAEEIRKREEQEIQDDYSGQDGEKQGREIEHLVLVTHGIGQRLSLRMESVNFVHDVNQLRKTLKGVYAHSADLKALNAESGEGPGNSRIQVLPVCWRHHLDFPNQRGKKAERDLGDTFDEEDDYPSLEDITIEGVAFARSLISDLALDVLLYQSAYREQISNIVCKESNRIHKLFMERNPDFKGQVHVVGHSLGSAIMFDLLCRQREQANGAGKDRNALRVWSQDQPGRSKDPRELTFDFDVDEFYCLGSPVGLFQMLKGRNIAARRHPHAAPSASPLAPDNLDNPFSDEHRISPVTGLPLSISSPKVNQLFNVFHPSDPIAYRLEPLVSPAMSSLKPQALPYTKKGIFGTVAPQGLSGIGVKVGQSVSGLWSSFSAGITSSILNHSLGITSKDMAKFNANNPSAVPTPQQQQQMQQQQQQQQLSPNDIISNVNAQSEKTNARQEALARRTSTSFEDDGTADGQRRDVASSVNATLIDDELETLYARFQKKRVEEHGEKAAAGVSEGQGATGGDGEGNSPDNDFRKAWAEEEKKAQKLRREEAKVRALNRNGRVDYSIQESALDFNPMNTIASHMSYWQDEDVTHFMISQMLASAAHSSRVPSGKGTGSGDSKGGIVDGDIAAQTTPATTLSLPAIKGISTAESDEL